MSAPSTPSSLPGNNNSSEDETSVEKVFDLIQQGKAQKTEGKHWDAAESFLEAYNLLTKLAANHNSNNSKNCHENKNPPATVPPPQEEEITNEDDEHAKIAKLYQDQSHEYFHRTRESLIAAMQQELKKDQEVALAVGIPQYLCLSLEKEEMVSRLRIFSAVFTKEMISTWMQEQQGDQVQQHAEEEEEDNTRVLKKQMSLEDRLMQLNASLPKELKSSGDRIKDLNTGMKRLGLGMYTDDNKPDPLKVEAPRSAAQQVEDIIAQAKDEVALEGPKNDGGDDDGSLSDNAPFSDHDDDDSEAFLSDDVVELQNVSKIRNQVAAAQAKLAELVALLDTVPAADEKEEAELQENGDGAASSFDPAYGKKVLKDSRQSLQQALKLWRVKLR